MRIIYRLGPALLLVIALIAATGCQLGASAADLVAKAKEHISQNDYQSARIELLNALQKDPNKVEARQLLATVALKLGDNASAVKEIRKAIALGLPREQGQPVLAKALLLQGDWDQVLAQTKDIPGSLPKSQQATLLGIRGKALVAKGHLEEAEKTLQHALSLDGKSPQALIGMAAMHAAQRQYSEAGKWLDQALAADPSSAEAWSTRGDLDLTLGKAAEADKAFSKAIEYRHYVSLDLAKRALARAQLGKFQEAQADIDKLQKAGAGDNPFVSYVSGVNYFYQKKYSDALLALQASAAKEPSYLPTNIFLAATHLALGNLEQALAIAQRVYSQAPDSLTTARLLGAVQVRRSELGTAKGVLEKALQKYPKNTSVLQTLTVISLLQGDTAAAVKYAEQVASLDPDSEQARNMVMLADLMNDQPITESASSGKRNPNATGEGGYTQEFLEAAGAFKQHDLQKALESAQNLHKKYPDKVDPIKLMAACHLMMGNWNAAKSELEQVLKLAPDDASSALNLAKVEVQLGKPEAARKLLEPLLTAHPGEEAAALLLASVDSRLGDTSAATDVLVKAVQSNPNALAARATLGGEYLHTGQLDKVLAITGDLSDEQLRKQPGLLELRGKAQILSGDVASATASFKHWTEIAPDSAPAHYFYGDSLARSGQGDAARVQIDRAAKLAPDYLPAQLGQIKLLAMNGKTNAAKQALQKAEKTFGDRVEILGMEGWLALQTKDYTTAAKQFAAAREKQPTTELTLYLVQALWEAGNHDRSIDVMKTWLKDKPRDIAIWLQLANAYLLSNKEDDAIAAYDQVIKLYPNHVPSLNNLAWLNRERDPAKAMEYAKRAYALAPKQPSVLDTMGVLLVRSGDTARGLSMLRGAFDQSPNNSEIGLHLAQALIQQKQFGEARAALQKLIDAAPTPQAVAKAKDLLASIKKN
ncbi:MAG TPA: XrtA/PEP-CTERM system TPR-repeat protein PrsT [Nitrococcus sp.]|nr:XrtA/PEP-CTERM system TPR-repeat protein PrsT [Nitrococcus sp.]